MNEQVALLDQWRNSLDPIYDSVVRARNEAQDAIEQIQALRSEIDKLQIAIMRKK